MYIYIYIYLLLIPMLWHRQAIFESKGDTLSPCWMQDSKLGSLRHQFASRLNAHSQTDWAIEDQAKKNWTQQHVPILSEQSAYLTSLPVGFHTWLWRYTCLLLISMLWHRQAVLESKEDTLYSSAQCRIRSWELYFIHSSSSILPLDIFLKKKQCG